MKQIYASKPAWAKNASVTPKKRKAAPMSAKSAKKVHDVEFEEVIEKKAKGRLKKTTIDSITTRREQLAAMSHEDLLKRVLLFEETMFSLLLASKGK